MSKFLKENEKITIKQLNRLTHPESLAKDTSISGSVLQLTSMQPPSPPSFTRTEDALLGFFSKENRLLNMFFRFLFSNFCGVSGFRAESKEPSAAFWTLGPKLGAEGPLSVVEDKPDFFLISIGVALTLKIRVPSLKRFPRVFF